MRSPLQDDDTTGNRWWGTFQVPHGRVARWQLGPTRVWVSRLPGEWQIHRKQGADPSASGLERMRLVDSDDVPDDCEVNRFGLAGTDETLSLAPRLADRPVVSKPKSTLHIPSGEEVVVFVGSPLWIAFGACEPIRSLTDGAIFRPSDTWFGPPTGNGEACYGSRTFCRLRREEMPQRPHRATTAVAICNRGPNVLSIEHLKLPVPNLALVEGGDGRLWT